MDTSCPTENRQQRTDAARAGPESSEEDRDSTARTGREAIQDYAHDAGKRPLKSKILSIRLLSGLSTEEPELGASNTRFGRDDPPDQAGNGDASGKPSTSNVRESSQQERKQAEQNQFDATKNNQIATVLNSIHQFKIRAHMLNRSRSAQEINRNISDKRSTCQRP